MAWLEKRGKVWKVCFRDDQRKVHRIKGYTDRAATKQLMAKLERDWARAREGSLSIESAGAISAAFCPASGDDRRHAQVQPGKGKNQPPEVVEARRQSTEVRTEPPRNEPMQAKL